MGNFDLNPHEIKPPHEANRPAILAWLVADMQKGWAGQELLVIKIKDRYQAWTGSHRIAAACIVGLSLIPCYVISENDFEACGVDVNRPVNNLQKLEALQKLGDERAIELIKDEGI